ncbi:MAG: hypothetical protein RR255_00270 [Bacilli bacterium]
MNWYKNYLGHFAQTPDEKYRDGTQAFIDSTWEDTTLIKNIEEETFIGSNMYVSLQVLKNSISEFFVNTTKDAKDFRRIMFKEVYHKSGRGIKYRFDNNYWLVYEETTEEEPYPEISVRRCNNIAKWIDKKNGNIIEEPCILDYTLSSPNVQVTKDVSVANSKVTLILQGNENTHKLRKNQRFIFNGVPYSFKSYNNYMQNDYVTKNVPLLFLDCYLDTEQPSDDLIDNIANRFDYKYSILINQGNIEQITGFKGKLTSTVLFNGEIVKEIGIKWSTSDSKTVSIDSQGNYHLLGLSGSIAVLRAYIDGNENVFSEITVNIIETVIADKILIITPKITELLQYETITINGDIYSNGIKEPDIVTCTANWENNNYTLTLIDKNEWDLTNNNMTKLPLELTFTNGVLIEKMTIKLKSA